MRPSLMQIGKEIDSRMLILHGTYFSLSEEQRLELVSDFYAFATEMVSEYGVLQWDYNIYSKISGLEKIKQKITASKPFVVGFSGDVLSDMIRNKTAITKFDRTACRTPGLPDTSECKDYDSYYRAHIAPVINDNELLKKAVLDLFDEPDRICLSYNLRHDFAGHLWGDCLPDLFCGSLEIRIRVYSLEDEIDAWAERLAAFSTFLSEKYVNINLWIEINTSSDVQGNYMGRHPYPYPTEKNETLWMYTRRLFLEGTGWSHTISPALQKIGNVHPTGNDSVEWQALSSGAVTVRSVKPITAAGIEDRKQVKRAIYGAILPSESMHPRDYRMRKTWECLPLFEDEVTVLPDKIRFAHVGGPELNDKILYDLINNPIG